MASALRGFAALIMLCGSSEVHPSGTRFTIEERAECAKARLTKWSDSLKSPRVAPMTRHDRRITTPNPIRVRALPIRPSAVEDHSHVALCSDRR
jgi:hypothetical protein